ncbi:MAG: BatD family protein, partial [Vicinamibacteria bacterium]
MNSTASRLAGAIILGTFCLLIFLPREAGAQDFRVQASVNANRIGMDDDLQLTVSIFGDSLGRASAPMLPKLEGFRIGGSSQSTSIQWINGRMSATRAITYRLVPVAEGKHTIDRVSVTYQGTQYLTEPIEVEVVAGSVRPQGGRRSDPFDAFNPPRQRRRAKVAGEVYVEAALSRPSTYVGEQVILIYKLYTQLPIMGLEVDQQPKLTGFWVEEVKMPKEPEWKETTVNGNTFYVFEIKKSILFPTKVGTATIEPATFSMAIRGSSDPFDSFFFRTADTIRRTTKPVSLEVKPLPSAGKPRDFSGAVGKFDLALEMDKDAIAAGEPLTVDVVVKGKGNLKTVEVPDLPTPDSFRTYDPKTEEKFSAGGSGFGGEKRWEFVLVPSAPGKYKLGPLSLSYFDPAKKSYVTAKAGPLTLNVGGATAIAGAPIAAPRSEVKLLRRDVRYLKPAPKELGVARAPFYRSGLFYATLALPMLW